MPAEEEHEKRSEYEDQTDDAGRVFDSGRIPGAIQCREDAGAAPLLHAVRILARLRIQAVPQGTRLQGRSERVPEALGDSSAA